MEPGGKGPLIIGVIITQTLVALIFVGLRAWTRIRLLGGFRYDDYLLWAAMILLIAITGESVGAVYHGLGRHTAELGSPEIMMELSKYLFAYPALLSVSLLVSKAAVVTFLIMIVVEKTHKIILWVSIGICGLFSLLEFIVLFVQCFPVDANWNPSTGKGCHFNVHMIGYILTAYGVFLDFFLAGLPWYFLVACILSGKRRSLYVSLSAQESCNAGVCGIIRLIEVVKLRKNPDRIYQFYSAIIWSSTETSVSIICVCLPATRTLYRRYIKGLGSSTDSTGVSGHHTKFGYTLQDRSRNHANTHTNTNTRSNANQTIVTGGAAGRRSKQLPSKDSEESILGEEFMMRQMGIKQTTSVTVDYESEVGTEGEISKVDVGKS